MRKRGLTSEICKLSKTNGIKNTSKSSKISMLSKTRERSKITKIKGIRK